MLVVMPVNVYSGCHATFWLKFLYILQYVQWFKCQSVENRTNETESRFNRTMRIIYRLRSRSGRGCKPSVDTAVIVFEVINKVK